MGTVQIRCERISMAAVLNKTLFEQCTRADLEALLVQAIASGAIPRDAVADHLKQKEERLKNLVNKPGYEGWMRIAIVVGAVSAAVGFVVFVGDNDIERWTR